MDFVKGAGDFSTSPEKAFDEIDPDWKKYPGLVIFGSHDQENIEEKIEKIRVSRENKIPTLGICFGLQLMAIEFARNAFEGDPFVAANLPEATSQEIDPDTKHPIVSKMEKRRVGIRKADGGYESFWHSYHVSPAYFHIFYKRGWNLSTDTENELVSMNLGTHPFFYGVQYHPEYQSTKDKPHPLLVRFLDACRTAATLRL